VTNEVNYFLQTQTNRLMWEIPGQSGQYTALGSSGVVSPYTAGEIISAGQWLYLYGDDDVRIANPTNLEAMTNVLGIARRSVQAGEIVPVQESGLFPFVASVGWQAKEDLYLFGNGQMTNDPNAINAGEFIQRVALVVSVTKSLIRIGLGEPVLLEVL
jgi:hypothetical protein